MSGCEQAAIAIVLERPEHRVDASSGDHDIVAMPDTPARQAIGWLNDTAAALVVVSPPQAHEVGGMQARAPVALQSLPAIIGQGHVALQLQLVVRAQSSLRTELAQLGDCKRIVG